MRSSISWQVLSFHSNPQSLSFCGSTSSSVSFDSSLLPFGFIEERHGKRKRDILLKGDVKVKPPFLGLDVEVIAMAKSGFLREKSKVVEMDIGE